MWLYPVVLHHLLGGAIKLEAGDDVQTVLAALLQGRRRERGGVMPAYLS